MSGKVESETKAFEKALKEASEPQGKYILRLYITGMTPKSRLAVKNIKKVCEENLKGRYELEVIDIRQQPELAQEANLIVAPTLVKKLPLPLKKLIGDMSDKEKVLAGLNIVPKK